MDDLIYEDVHDTATRVESFIRRYGGTPELSTEKLANQILQYIRLRQSGSSTLNISQPLHTCQYPPEWNDTHETLWQDWISLRYDLADWQRQVIRPVFGTDVRLWEANCEGWRDEIYTFLPWWIQRNVESINDIRDEEDSDSMEEGATSKIDPYLLDYGGYKKKYLHD
jgi:hypothetical protein